MYLAVFLVVLAACMAHVGRNGDHRDMAAGLLICVQFGLESLFSGNFLVSGGIFLGALALFVLFAVRATGALLGLLSGFMVLCAGLAHFGVLPADKGAGVAVNYHHYITALMYGQIAILWSMAGNERFSDV